MEALCYPKTLIEQHTMKKMGLFWLIVASDLMAAAFIAVS